MMLFWYPRMLRGGIKNWTHTMLTEYVIVTLVLKILHISVVFPAGAWGAWTWRRSIPPWC